MKKQSILITGASSGIGKACALYLDQLGYKVYAGVRKDSDKQQLSSEGSERLIPVILDVTNRESIIAAEKFISEEIEYPLYGLVNNAGAGISGVIEATPLEEFRNLLEINVLGVHQVTQSFLPLLRKNRGRIVNIGSSAAFFAGPGSGPYAASKFALRAYTDSLRIELKQFDMDVSLVAPGAVESKIWEKASKYKEKYRNNTDPNLLKLYEVFTKAGEKIISQIKPIAAIEVARAVHHGLASVKSRNLYLVGKDSKVAFKIGRMPQNLSDKLMLARMKKIAGK